MNILLNDTTKADTFCSLFQHIKLFTDHVNISFSPERFYMQCMDQSHVAILEIAIPANWFNEYTPATPDTSVTIGVNTVSLYRILSSREKGQQLSIIYEEETPDRLQIHLTSNNKNEFDKHFEMPLIEIDTDTMEIPAIEYQAELSLASTQFAGIINQLKMFGDTLDIQCSEEKIVMASNSIEQGKMFVEINIDDLSLFAIEEGESLELSYSLTYLHHICMYNKLAKEVAVKFSNSYPMQVMYIFGSGKDAKEKEEKGQSEDAEAEEDTDLNLVPRMVFYLAPKIAD